MPSKHFARRLRCATVCGLLTALLSQAVHSSDAQPDDRVNPGEYASVFRYESNRLSANVTDMPVRSLILELGRQSGARVRIDGLENRTVSDSFERLPLEEALRRLLGDRSFTLIYSQEQNVEGHTISPRLKELRVFGGEGAVVTSPGRQPKTSAPSTRPTAAGPAAVQTTPARGPAPAGQATPPAAQNALTQTAGPGDTAHESEPAIEPAVAVEAIDEPSEPEPWQPMAGARPGLLNPVAGAILGDEAELEDEWSQDVEMDEPIEEDFDGPVYEDYAEDEDSVDD